MLWGRSPGGRVPGGGAPGAGRGCCFPGGAVRVPRRAAAARGRSSCSRGKRPPRGSGSRGALPSRLASGDRAGRPPRVRVGAPSPAPPRRPPPRDPGAQRPGGARPFLSALLAFPGCPPSPTPPTRPALGARTGLRSSPESQRGPSAAAGLPRGSGFPCVRVSGRSGGERAGPAAAGRSLKPSRGTAAPVHASGREGRRAGASWGALGETSSAGGSPG